MIALSGALVGAGLAVVFVPRLGAAVRGTLVDLRRRVVDRLRDDATRRLASDLSICGRTSEAHVARRLLGALSGLAAALASSGLLAMIGGQVGSIGSLVVAAVGIAAGFVVPDVTLRKAAARRRRAFLHAFSSYLDLTNVLLAGGAGIETALVAAAEAGDGWAFGRLRDCLVRARGADGTVWVELARLGERYGIEDVVEVAGSLQLAGRHGARIRASLAARADSLRSRQLSEIEASAHAATERMGLPLVLLFVGFLCLVGYPAVALVLEGL